MYENYPEAWPATTVAARDMAIGAPQRRSRKVHSVLPGVIADRVDHNRVDQNRVDRDRVARDRVAPGTFDRGSLHEGRAA